MLDLVKAFEMVRLELVWARGLELGFPAVVLRATLESFSFARRLMLDGAVSDPVSTCTAILAGGGFATDAMFIVLLKPCDTIARSLPTADLCLFVDDLTIHVVGSESAVHAQLTAAIDLSIELLEDDMELQLSRTKTTVTASSWTLARRLRPKLKLRGIGVHKSAKLLGVDFSCGKRVARSAQVARVKKVTCRKTRYSKLGKNAASRLVKAGAAPAMNYGASVYGTPSTTLKAIRGFACSVRGEMRGRSTFARLELAKYDPGTECAVGPILEWAKAIWDEAVSHEELRVVWKQAHCLIAHKASPFRHVAGPGGAMLASCLRLGWKVPRHDIIMKRDGTMLDLSRTCPKQVNLHALQDLRLTEALSSSLTARIGGPPDLEPLSDYLATKKMLRSPAAASLRALGEGGWWTQERLFQEGRADDPWCKACGDRGGIGQIRGTLYHRMCGCSATVQARNAFKGQDLLRKAQSALHCEEPLFKHGIPLLVEPPGTPLHEVRSCGGFQPPPDFTASGTAFTDGAMRGRAPKSARRAGWAWVVVDESGQIVYGLFGPCPDPFPTAFRAELRAVCELLMIAVPPLTIHTDNKEVLDGWCKGRQWCTSSARSAADLWRWFWDKIEDIDSDDIQLVKTKGHATEVDVQLGRCSEMAKNANDHADHFAGRGVDVAEHQSPNARLTGAYHEAINWYKWLTVLCTNWPKDTDPKPARRTPKATAPPPERTRAAAADVNEAAAIGAEEKEAAERRHATRSEEVEEAEDKEAAERRHATRSTEAEGADDKEAAVRRRAEGQVALEDILERRRPGGSTAGGSGSSSCFINVSDEEAATLKELSLTNALHSSHSLRLAGSVVWCDHCGAYAQERFKDLKQPCLGSQKAAARKGQLALLRKGRHPIRGTLLGGVTTLAVPATVASTAASSNAKQKKKEIPSRQIERSLRDVARSPCARSSSVACKAIVRALSRPVYQALGVALGRLI